MSVVLDPLLDISRNVTREPESWWKMQAIELRLRGMRMNEIAERVGKAPATVSNHLPQGLTVLSPHDLGDLRSVDEIPADPDQFLTQRREERAKSSWERRKARLEERRKQRAREAVARKSERQEARAKAREVAREKTGAEQWLRKRVAMEWKHARLSARAVLRRQAREERARERAQHRHRWAAANSQQSQVVSLDYELAEDFTRRDVIADPSQLGQDPFHILTGTSADHLQELLGDLGIEDIGRMDEWQLERLRERILEAGLAPSSVQRSERERLKTPTPHRGQAPSVKQGRKQARHRGRNEASALHQSRGKRFVRRNDKQPGDGWGGVVLP